MSIDEAIKQIDAGEQSIPSNPLANTGLSDPAYWHEVREWLEGMQAPSLAWAQEANARSLDALRRELQANALEDAANELAYLQYVKPRAEGREEYERALAVRRGNTDKWLKARAKEIRGGNHDRLA